ncbi:MAG: hypothetical protein LCH53_04295 [Bacteroidetes bacterium]|nr:hypothetical protein [Bacteroidota bacterium]
MHALAPDTHHPSVAPAALVNEYKQERWTGALVSAIHFHLRYRGVHMDYPQRLLVDARDEAEKMIDGDSLYIVCVNLRGAVWAKEMDADHLFQYSRSSHRATVEVRRRESAYEWRFL